MLKRTATSQGIVFVYSRFIKSGAVPLAIALEANGYTPWNRDKPLFVDGVQDGLGLQCALCNYSLGKSCLECTGPLTCTRCDSGFYLQGGKCISCS